MKADNDNHAEIYLQPPGTAEAPEGRLWCQDDAPFDCEDDDGNVVPWVKYVRSDIHDALAARLAEAEQEYQDARVVREQLEARLADTEANLERLQQRWATRPATEELEARLAEAEQEYQDARVVREQLEARLADTEANLERLQQRWATRPATEELEARLAEAEALLREIADDQDDRVLPGLRIAAQQFLAAVSAPAVAPADRAMIDAAIDGIAAMISAEALCDCDLPMPANPVNDDGRVWCSTCGFNIGTTVTVTADTEAK